MTSNFAAGLGRLPIGASIEQQLEHKTDRSGDCWLWIGKVRPDGYGFAYVKGKTKFAHKVSYEYYVGKVPDGMQLDHKYVSQGCPRHCVNPEHLQVVTQQQNLENISTVKGRSTHRGVLWRGNAKRWIVVVVKEGKRSYGGSYPLYETHVAAYYARKLRNTVMTNNRNDRL